MDLRNVASLRGHNFYDADPALQSFLRDNVADFDTRWKAGVREFGAFVADDVDRQAEYADRYFRPKLEHYQEDGRYQSRVVYNDLWVEVSREVYRRGIVGLSYGEQPAPYAVTFAMAYLLGQADISLHCPVGMTAAVAYVVDRFAPPPLRARYLPRLTSLKGDAFTAGTWATEHHGGSDVGATTSEARAEGDHFVLSGLKWFVSNAGGDLAIATARPTGAPAGSKGLGLYLVPARWTDGSANTYFLHKLKEKLGTCGIATAEVELAGCKAFELAPPPQGLRIMMEALEFSRIQNVLGSMGIQRRAMLEAARYAYQREAFGRKITGYPMVREQLAEIAIRVEASVALGFEVVRAFEAVGHEFKDTPARMWLRLMTAIAKYQTAEHANVVCRKALEAMGANAYTSDYCLPRLMRDAQALSIWEGPANIQALEMIRMLSRQGALAPLEQRAEALRERLPSSLEREGDRLAWHLDKVKAGAQATLSGPAAAESHARNLMEYLAGSVSGLLLLEAAAREIGRGDARPALVARLFIESHLDRTRDRDFGPGHALDEREFDALMNQEPIAVTAAASAASA